MNLFVKRDCEFDVLCVIENASTHQHRSKMPTQHAPATDHNVSVVCRAYGSNLKNRRLTEMRDGRDGKEAQSECGKVHLRRRARFDCNPLGVHWLECVLHRYFVVAHVKLVVLRVAWVGQVPAGRPLGLVVGDHLGSWNLRNAVDLNRDVLGLRPHVATPAPVGHVQGEEDHRRVGYEAEQIEPPEHAESDFESKSDVGSGVAYIPNVLRRGHSGTAKAAFQIADLVHDARARDAVLAATVGLERVPPSVAGDFEVPCALV